MKAKVQNKKRRVRQLDLWPSSIKWSSHTVTIVYGERQAGLSEWVCLTAPQRNTLKLTPKLTITVQPTPETNPSPHGCLPAIQMGDPLNCRWGYLEISNRLAGRVTVTQRQKQYSICKKDVWEKESKRMQTILLGWVFSCFALNEGEKNQPK